MKYGLSTRRLSMLAAFILCAASLPVAAAEVALVGIFPGKAVLSIDGGAIRTLAVDQSYSGVKLVAIERDAVIIESGGKRERIELGVKNYSAGNGSDAGGAVQSITLNSDAQGHFPTQGTINGAAMTFVVDTGATWIALGPSQAKRAGLDYMKGKPMMAGTANGNARVSGVTLDTVTVNGLTLRNVEAVIVPQDMPAVLLGMSFLNRMSMTRDGDTMVLKRRY